MQKMNTIALAAMHVVTFLRLDRTSKKGVASPKSNFGRDTVFPSDTSFVFLLEEASEL